MKNLHHLLTKTSKWSDWPKIGLCKPAGDLVSCCTAWIWESLSHSPPRRSSLCFLINCVYPILTQLFPSPLVTMIVIIVWILIDIDNNHFETYFLEYLHHHLWSPGACTGVCQIWIPLSGCVRGFACSGGWIGIRYCLILEHSQSGDVGFLFQHFTFHIFELVDAFTKTSIDHTWAKTWGLHLPTFSLLLSCVFKQHFGADLQLFLQVLSIIRLLLLLLCFCDVCQILLNFLNSWLLDYNNAPAVSSKLSSSPSSIVEHCGRISASIGSLICC